MMEAAQTVLQDPSVLKASVFCVAAAAGQLFHVAKKVREGYKWFFANPGATVAAIAANLVGMLGFVSLGGVTALDLGTVIALGLFMGHSADSAINKGSQIPWDDAKRAAEAAKK